MQLSFDEERLNGVVSAPALPPFSDKVIAFLNDLSSVLMKTGRTFSDVVTFAYWCRKAALTKAKENYTDLDQRLGRGVVFHIAPSNVPVNFAFSMVSGLLAGNKNIVRLSSKPFAQVDIIADAIEKVIDESYPEFKDYIYLLRYDHSDEITAKLSAVADTRVIWGGDATIATIRRAPLKARANEITFADRHALCVMSADAYNAADNKDQVILKFYNDTYFSDQNACTSPRIVVWTGEGIEEAKKDFWDRLGQKTEKDYHIEPVQIVGKLSMLMEASTAEPLHLKTSLNAPKLMVAETEKIDDRLMEFKYNSGYFYEYSTQDLTDILPLCDTRCSTIAYYGDVADKLLKAVRDSGCPGVDRIVPLGTTMDFSLRWDGYDLIISMSRFIGVN